MTPLSASPRFNTITELARQRSQLYQLLSTLFGREPTAELLERLDDPEVAAALGECGMRYQDTLWQRPLAERLSELEVEYTRLFIGPGPHIALQESVQRGEGQLWGKHTCEVVQCYAQAGYVVDPAWKDLPDHLAVELQFLGFLAEREADCIERSDTQQAEAVARQQAEFLQQHLRQWVPQVIQQTTDQSTCALYREFAGLLARALTGSSGTQPPPV